MAVIVRAATAVIAIMLLSLEPARSYPLNGFETTHIPRLEGYFYALRTPSGKRNFVPGALLGLGEIHLRFQNVSSSLPLPDAHFSEQLRQLLGDARNAYSIALLDLTNPQHPVYATHNARTGFTPGSVGKIVVAAAVFQMLANIYPHDIAARQRVLRDTVIDAGEIIGADAHDVPFWHRDEGRIEFRPLKPNDRANLWTFLDWMLSASSNAAANVIMRELLLLKRFGTNYPPVVEERERYIKNTPAEVQAREMQDIMVRALHSVSLPTSQLYQASLFTKLGQELIPSRGSTATGEGLVKFMLLIEQGKLIDPFSSLEMKRLLYLTQPRIRYASCPDLDNAAIYYKSGSLFRCRGTPGEHCSQYHGTLVNLMNSVAIVEFPAENPRYHYIVALSSNVLRRSSEQEHVRIAAHIQRLIEERHG